MYEISSSYSVPKLRYRLTTQIIKTFAAGYRITQAQ